MEKTCPMAAANRKETVKVKVQNLERLERASLSFAADMCNHQVVPPICVQAILGGLSLVVALHPVDRRSHILGPSQYREGPAVGGSWSFLVILNLGLACITNSYLLCYLTAMLGYSHVAPLEQLGSSIQQLTLFATMGIKDPMVAIFLDCLIGHQHCPLLNSHGKLVASSFSLHFLLCSMPVLETWHCWAVIHFQIMFPHASCCSDVNASHFDSRRILLLSVRNHW